MAYATEYSDVREYLLDAHIWLEDAESALSIFLDRSDPRTDEAEFQKSRIKDLHTILKRMIRDYEGILYGITEDLPERE